MGWNDPGRGQDPWGRRGASGPFDLDAIIQRLWRRLRRHRGAPPPWVFGVTAFAVMAGWLVTGFYSVPQGDRAVLLQFGQAVRVTRPGAHWRWPAPLASDRVVSIRQIHVVAVGYRPVSKLYEGEPAPAEAAMLTGDQGIVRLQFAIQYRIVDPRHYLFNVDHPRKAIARAAEAVMRQAVAGSSSNAVLAHDAHQLAAAAKTRLQALLDRYGAGVHVVAIKIQKATPPKSVLAALEKVVRAREDAKRYASEAQAYADSILPKASADGVAMIDKAHIYRAHVMAKARARSARFLALAKIYERAPLVTRERLLIDAMARVYRKAHKVMVSGASHTVVDVPMASPAKPPVLAEHAPAGAGTKR